MAYIPSYDQVVDAAQSNLRQTGRFLRGERTTVEEVKRGVGDLARKTPETAQALTRALRTVPGIGPLAVAATAGLEGGEKAAKLDLNQSGAAGAAVTAVQGAGESLARQMGEVTGPLGAGKRAYDRFMFGQGADTAKSVPATQAKSAVAEQPKPKPVGAAAGPDTLLTENAGEKKEPPKSTYEDRVRAVRLPSGRVVFTNVADEYVKKGTGTPTDYGLAISQVTGKPFHGGADVYEGPAGTAYIQPGAGIQRSALTNERAAANAIPGPTPRLEDALPPLSDPIAIEDRRRFMEERAAREARAASVATQEAKSVAEATKAQAEAQQAVALAEVSPTEKARIEAEGRYGGEQLKTTQEAEQTHLAIELLNRINGEINRAMKEMPPGPERDQYIRQLEENRKLYLIAVRPGAATGLMKPDPYAAFSGPTAAPAPAQ